jgi:amino acid transporter
MRSSSVTPSPARTLSPVDAVAIIVGVVIGAGIFKTPSVVAAHAGSAEAVVLFWLLGGALSFVGALCYAELTTAFPDSGGDYYFIRRAFGLRPAFLFAWARSAVIQTGSIAMLGFVIGDYTAGLLRTGSGSSAWYAAGAIALLTAVNRAGIRQGKLLQNLLTLAIIIGLASLVLAGVSLSAPPSAAPPLAGSVPGKAMIFVLLTYGGWNEAAYISAEIRNVERNMTRILFFSIGLVTFIYTAVNIVYIKGLGLAATAQSQTAAADLMRLVMGESGARLISLLIVVAAVSTMNAVIITGARTNYALGRDFRLLQFLGSWREHAGAPEAALLVQAVISFLLVGLGALTRDGFSTMVEYTAPVFWFFFLLVGLALFVLRWKEPGRPRPFRVPFYPLTPVVFCLFCLYMFQSSFRYVGAGALTGVAVLAAGLPLMYLALKKER